jgi:DNA-binding NarL/FixJ family response regulator
MNPTRILIVDDHETFRKGLRSFLQTRSEFEICGEAANGQEAIERTKELLPDIVLMDVSMPQIDGLQATRIIRQEVPGSRVLIVSQHDSSLMLSEALRSGASAYVTKSQVSRSLLAVLDGIVRGRPSAWNGQGSGNPEPPARPDPNTDSGC